MVVSVTLLASEAYCVVTMETKINDKKSMWAITHKEVYHAMYCDWFVYLLGAALSIHMGHIC